MRDFVLLAVSLIVAPAILVHPYIGGLAWVVHAILSPQSLVWGFASSLPFGVGIVALTVAGSIVSKDRIIPKGGTAAVVLAVVAIWCTFTTFAIAFEPDAAYEYWVRTMKIWFMTFALIFLINTRRHLDWIIWAMVLSLGYYSMKGGLFTLLKGGEFIVWGPAASVIANSNHLAVAIVMCIPLAAYLYDQAAKRAIRWGLIGGILLSSVCVLGSYSRGALLAVAAMGLFLALRSRNKAPFLIIALLVPTVVVPFMPSQWEARMGTIKTYKEEGSAMARLNAWEAAYNVAKDRFPLGAGFEYQSEQFSARYAPDPTLVHVAHSLYFQTLGGQGFIGLVLLMWFWFLVWRACSRIRKQTLHIEELAWARSLASMVQVSLVGYFVGGAFIDTAFWDLPFYLFTIVAITSYLVTESLKTSRAEPGQAPAERPLGGVTANA